MPREMTVQVYQYDELSDKAKAKAHDWFREGFESSDLDNVIDQFAEVAGWLGFELKQIDVPLHNGKTRKEPAIYWSGFSSQGDGACFEGNWSYRANAVAKVKE